MWVKKSGFGERTVQQYNQNDMEIKRNMSDLHRDILTHIHSFFMYRGANWCCIAGTIMLVSFTDINAHVHTEEVIVCMNEVQ